MFKRGVFVKKVLVIEDDEMLNAGMCFNIQKAGHEPISVMDLTSAEPYIKNQEIDLILLDVNLPDGNGFDFAKKISEYNQKPLIFLTAHELDDEVIKGFELGADDYVTKPFNPKIAMQRINAVLRRSDGFPKTTVYSCGNLHVDFDTHTVKKNEEIIHLTPTEYKLLYTFVKNPNIALTRSLLLEKLWDSEGNFVDEHTLTINISRLKNKIADDQYTYIKTIYGMGYQWIGDKNA